jgi:hypothetical protein
METIPKDELLLIVKTSKNYWSRNSCIAEHAWEFAIRGIQKALDEVLDLKEPKDKIITEDEFYGFVEYAISYWHWNITLSTIWAKKHIVENFMRAAKRVFDFVEAESAENKGISRYSVSRSQTSKSVLVTNPRESRTLINLLFRFLLPQLRLLFPGLYLLQRKQLVCLLRIHWGGSHG